MTGLRLQPTSGRGALIVLDASLRGPGLPAIAPIELPRVDVGALSVREGGPALRTLRLPLTVTGTATPGAKVRVFVTAPSGRQTARTVALTPGASRIVVPVPVRGNSRYDLASPGPVVAIFPVAGARTGHSATTIDMREDDPRPRVLVTPRRISVREGELVRIRVRLTRRVTSAGFEIVAVPLPAGRRPLRLGDVDQATGFWSLPGRASQPLAGGGFAGFASFDPVTSTAILELRFAEDGRREPPEHATLRLRAGFGGEERILPRPIDIPLTVRDA